MLPWMSRLLRVLAALAIIAVLTAVAYRCQAEAFVAGFIYLLPIVFIAFGWGLLEASIASVAAVACLDYFFTPLVFRGFNMVNEQDWVALAGFEAVVLVVSRLADRLKHQAALTNAQRERVEKLYLMSRDILLMDRHKDTCAQLARLVIKEFEVDGIAFWDAREAEFSSAGTHPITTEEGQATYLNQNCENDLAQGVFRRVLMAGTRPIGALLLVDKSGIGHIGALSVDAIASLSSIAMEHSHLLMTESLAEAAKRSEQLRSTVLDGLAHSFKTPLATIQTASSGLLEIGTLSAAETELVSLINQKSVYLANLATQALQTARVSEEQVKVDRQTLDLDSFLRSCTESTRQILAEHPLTWSVDGAPNRNVWADPQLLEMALVQLLDNATKYSDPGSPIELRAAASDKEVLFSVHNYGSYIEPSEQRRIFERYYRIPGSEYRAPGTGIGLAVTKQIADAHEGRVWIESQSGSGTTVFLALPNRSASGSRKRYPT
jgi:two-component system sensor histidine kinase KdpD